MNYLVAWVKPLTAPSVKHVHTYIFVKDCALLDKL